MKPFSRILVPTDFSAPARDAVDLAVDLAARFGASLTLFHVQELPMSYASEAGLFGVEVLESLEADAQKSLLQEKARAERQIGSPGIANAPPIATKLALGVPVVAIDDEVRSGRHDLVVIGSHGRTGLAHVLLGSVAERVLRSAGCPVITVR
jgi:nucleotide-binding universal stress UspA family protein